MHADLAAWDAGPDRYSLVLCTNFWERAVFDAAVGVVAAGGVLAWEALTDAARQRRPELPAQWCLRPGEPASLLPDGLFDVLDQHDVPGQPGQPAMRRQLLARRRGAFNWRRRAPRPAYLVGRSVLAGQSSVVTAFTSV